MPDALDLGNPLSEKELCPEDLLKGQEDAFARDIERLKARKKEFVSVTCPACQGDENQKIFEKYSFSYVRCSRCQTIYMNPRPSPEVMEAYYQNSENYKFWAEHIFPASEEARKNKIHRLWLERILKYCSDYQVDRKKLVEIGAGFGTFLSLAKERFASVVGIEPTPELAQICQGKQLPVIPKRIEDIENEILESDVVVGFEIIEHLFEPRILIESCRRFLKKGGLLILSCPNGLGFDIDLLRERALAVDAEHVNLFNPESLSHLLNDCGFEVLNVSTPGRLDAEFVREAILKGDYAIENQGFLKKVLIDEWDRLGWPFQNFLAQNNLSSHMWLVART